MSLHITSIKRIKKFFYNKHILFKISCSTKLLINVQNKIESRSFRFAILHLIATVALFPNCQLQFPFFHQNCPAKFRCDSFRNLFRRLRQLFSIDQYQKIVIASSSNALLNMRAINSSFGDECRHQGILLFVDNHVVIAKAYFNWDSICGN